MFDNWHLRPFAQPGIDIYQIIREAQTRWLRPVEVIEILRNHQIFRLNPVPPNKPPSGSLFLFDRKTLRFFRKDGHNWRKKKDGKTVREAHERLKAGSIDILHCYYAHGEDNVNFQRRSYWMLEGAYEHIVLVHYREVTEGSRTCVVRTVNEIREPPISATERDSHSPSLISTHTRPSESLPQTHGFSSPETSEVEVTGPYQSPESVVDSALPEIEEIDSGEEAEEILAPVLGASEEQHSSLLQQLSVQNEKDTYMDYGGTSKEWPSSATFSSGIGHDFQSHTPLSQKGAISAKGGPDLPQRPYYVNRGSEKQVIIDHSVTHLENASTVQLEDSSHNPERFLGQRGSPSGTFDISGWNTLLENFRGSGTPQGTKMPWKQDLKSPTWAEMLEKAMISPAENNRYNFLASKGSEYSMHGDVVSFEPIVSQSSKRYAHASAPSNTEDARESQLDCIVQTNSSGAAAKFGTFEASMTSQVCSGSTSDQFLHDGLRQEEQLLTMKEMLSSNQSDPNFWQQKPRHEYSREQNHDQELRAFQQEQNLVFNGSLDPQLGRFPTSPLPLAIEDVEQSKQGGLESFKKLDSFGRWMSEMGEDSEGSLIPGSYWATPLDGPGPVESISSFSQQMQMDVGLSPSLAQEQRFSISDFSPEWTFSSGGSKVVIVGEFLDRGRNFSEYTWCCMFGEVEVPADVIQVGVLRCKAPPHESGRVPFYITCRDRLACSEIREFEYRLQSSTSLEALSSRSLDPLKSNSQDIRSSSLLVRFARLLSSKPDEPLVVDDLWSKEELGSVEKICYLTSNSDEEWTNLDTHAKGLIMSSSDVKEQVLQILFKQKLQDFLLRKAHEEKRGVCAFDNGGQGVLHLAATLGYDWAVAPILAAGVGVNFRDLHGWTALHWAASYGREKVVLALLAAGAAPGPLTDPTPHYPSGRTPADLAASSGHGGMAGYLAELSLTTHLSSLALKEKNMNEIEAFSDSLAEEKAMDYLSERTNVQQNLEGADEQITLQGSLRAVRNAARAAALIQATFRRHSFRKRQECLELEVLDDYTMSQEEIKSMVAGHKIQKAYPGHRKEKLHAAAVQIQCKFRSWKGRKDFLTLRQRVVKIQAHVRGHQVRSKCRRLLWSVGILEKAVLRWRRKGTGLRGFRAESTFSGSNVQDGSQSDGVEDVLKAGRKEKEAAIQNAVTRVQSMVKSDEARAQYWRLVEGYRQTTTVEDSGVTSGFTSNHANPPGGTEDYIMFGET